MARHHIGLGLSGLFIVFMIILLVLPYIKSSVNGFADISIVTLPPDTKQPTTQPTAKPKYKPQKRSKYGGF